MLGSCVDWFERSVLIKVVWRFDSKLCRLGGGAGRGVGEPGTERIPGGGRPGDGATKVVEVAAAKGANAADLGELGAWSGLNGSSSLCPASSEAASKSKLATALGRAVGDSGSKSCASSWIRSRFELAWRSRDGDDCSCGWSEGEINSGGLI
jgi:hypothetical protein